MSCKIISLIALAAMVLASVTIPGFDGAAALAEEANRQLAAEGERSQPVRETPTLVAEPVEPQAAARPSPGLAEAGSLAELVGRVNTSAPLDAELRCLAAAVYFEARGEPIEGQLAVAQVIINRSKDPRFPRTYCGVVAQPGQFSFMRGGRMPRLPIPGRAWARAVAIATIADRGLWPSAAKGAVFFHARHVKPRWSRGKTRLAQIDAHIFYR
jgi:spore germination cell wall hydrolase CwlJ-like protein